MVDQERFTKGVAVVQQLFGPAVAGGGGISPDFQRLTVENLFGDVWARPGLKIEERSMITVAALIVLGREAELRLHLRGARNVGLSREKLEEMMMHLAHYGGWPVAVSAMRTLDEVWTEMDAQATA